MNLSTLDPAEMAQAMRDDGMAAALADDRPDLIDCLDVDDSDDTISLREGWFLLWGAIAAAALGGFLAGWFA